MLPYIAWNLIAFIILKVLYPALFCLSGHDCIPEQLLSVHMVYESFLNFGGVPVDGPLYFVRNLFILVVLSPLFFFFIKRIKYVFVIIIVLSWLFIDSSDLSLYSYEKSIPFFTMGATLGILKPNIMQWVKSQRILLIIFLAVCVIDGFLAIGFFNENSINSYNNVGLYNEINQFSFRLSMLVGVFAVWVLMISNVLSSKRTYSYKRWNKAVFFIYASHIFVLPFIPSLIKSFAMMSEYLCIYKGLGFTVGYLLGVSACILLPILLYNIGNRYAPAVTSILSGNRN